MTLSYQNMSLGIGNGSEVFIEIWRDPRMDDTDIGSGLVLPWKVTVKLLNGDKHYYEHYNRSEVKATINDRLNNVGTDVIEVKRGNWLTARYVTRWSAKDSMLRQLLREEYVKNKENRGRLHSVTAKDRTTQIVGAAENRVLEQTATTIDLRKRAMWNHSKLRSIIKRLTRDPHGDRTEGVRWTDYDNKTWMTRITPTGEIETKRVMT